jgi:hypothetical protein
MKNLPDSGMLKPGEVRERKKQFFVLQQQPETMPRDIGYFN